MQPTITQIYKNHTFKYGYDFRRLHERFSTLGNSAGRYTFDGTYTMQASNSGATQRDRAGRDIASFLLGIPVSGSIDNPTEYDTSSIYHALFVQDDFRVSQNPKKSDDKWLEKTKPDYKSVSWNDVLKQKPLWYQTDEAARIADQLLLYQKDNGGWEKNLDMAAMLTQAEKNALAVKKSDVSETTIDNKATYTQIEYLGKVITASLLKTTPPNNFPKYKESFNKGVDYLLSSQYESGGFPQFFPLKKGYYSHITFNDDAMIGVLKLLREIAKKSEDYIFIDEERRVKAEKAVEKALPLLLKTQIEIGGVKTVWAAQYDETTLKPAAARKFEPVSLMAGESVGIVRFLMLDANPNQTKIDAIEAAVNWFRANKIEGIRWEKIKGENLVIKDKTAPPIWARFYEIAPDETGFHRARCRH